MTSSTVRLGGRLILCGGLCLALAGCYQRKEYKAPKVAAEVLQQRCGDQPAPLRPLCERVYTEGARNAVLNQMRLGLRAMELGYWDESERAFDRAIDQIEAVYADHEAARKARSLYYEEGLKDFKGEPYERCMAYYYRGLLYLREGDFDNARASFKGGILQDAFAEEDQNRCDFALLIFLEGWAAQQDGDAAAAEVLYEEVKKYRPDFEVPGPEDRVLIVAETGTSPRKVADGVGHSELKFRRGRSFTENRARVAIDDRDPVTLFPIEDVMWQAGSRGGRAVDKILAGKAEFRQKNEQMGTVLTDVSSTAMLSAPMWGDDMGAVQGISAAVGLVGVMQMAAAAKAQPHADTRYWDNLPDAVHVLTVAADAGPMQVRVEFQDENDTVLADLSREKTCNIAESGSTLLWFRSREGVFQDQR